MTVTIHQPEHLPWLGFFNKMQKADVFVYLDNVQYRKNYYQNRNKIMGTNGPQWLTIPVSIKNHTQATIADMKVSYPPGNNWSQKNFQNIYYSYKRHPYFNQHIDFFKDLFEIKWDSLSDLNCSIIDFFVETLDIKTSFCKASNLSATGANSDLVLNICQELNAKTYIAGPSGRDYLKLKDFEEAGIEVVFNDYVHPTYKQYGKVDFTPYMTTLDLIFNYDVEESKKIIFN